LTSEIRINNAKHVVVVRNIVIVVWGVQFMQQKHAKKITQNIYFCVRQKKTLDLPVILGRSKNTHPDLTYCCTETTISGSVSTGNTDSSLEEEASVTNMNATNLHIAVNAIA
jgi:hypothetical protein